MLLIDIILTLFP